MSGLNRIILGKLTEEKKQGEALTKAVGEAFSPEAIMQANEEESKGDEAEDKEE